MIGYCDGDLSFGAKCPGWIGLATACRARAAGLAGTQALGETAKLDPLVCAAAGAASNEH